MLKTIAPFTPAILLASQLCAGGFFLQLGNPQANPEARKLNAELTIKAAGCHDPAGARVSASAIGMVNGQRRQIPLTVTRLSEPGTFVISQQWPKRGNWVIKLEAANDAGQFTNSLIAAGPDGIDLGHERAAMKAFADSDVDAMLK
ncbi:MAG: hypothetical protein ABSH56_31425 [Bryobacteraceae bacterium]